MNSGVPDEIGARRRARPTGDKRLAGLAAELGLDLPPFSGPLAAFQIGEERGRGERIYLGGDLHTTHPDSGERVPRRERDPSLDCARIKLTDLEHETLEVTAVEGIWCLALPADQIDPAPYFTLRDAEGHTRTWLLLPPPYLMLGIAHLWLPAVPPPGGPYGETLGVRPAGR